MHEDGHQEGVRVGYAPRGPKPSHHPLMAALAEPKLVCGFWLRSGNTAALSNAAISWTPPWPNCPRRCGSAWCGPTPAFTAPNCSADWKRADLDYIVVAARLRKDVQALCRHADTARAPTEVRGLEVQEVDDSPLHGPAQRRLIIIRQAHH